MVPGLKISMGNVISDCVRGITMLALQQTRSRVVHALDQEVTIENVVNECTSGINMRLYTIVNSPNCP